MGNGFIQVIFIKFRAMELYLIKKAVNQMEISMSNGGIKF